MRIYRQAERIDHRSYKRQGIDQTPTIHLGVSACQMEQKGIATERGNLNRQIKSDNKELRVAQARITRLMKWQREEKSKPLDLTQTDFKASVMDKLKANKSVINNRYRTTKDLKNYANVWNFLQSNNIDNIEDFTRKIVDMKDSFYALQGEVQRTEKGIASLDNRLALWSEYQSFRPFIDKYRKLQGKDKTTAYNTRKDKIERYKSLHNHFTELRNSGDPLKPKIWEREKATLQKDITLCDWKMKVLKDEIGSAENIQKLLTQTMNGQPQERKKERETER